MEGIEIAIAEGKIKINYQIEIDEIYFENKYAGWNSFPSKVKIRLRERTIDFLISKLPTPINFI